MNKVWRSQYGRYMLLGKMLPPAKIGWEEHRCSNVVRQAGSQKGVRNPIIVDHRQAPSLGPQYASWIGQIIWILG